MTAPVLLVPGLLCSSEIFVPQLPVLWARGPVAVAHTLDGESIEAIATAILAAAPPTFALCGISMGGYLCFEILRRAPERVTRLALLDTSARPDTPEQARQREEMLAQAEAGDFVAWALPSLTSILHPAHQHDPAIASINARMAKAVGIHGYRRQTHSIIASQDSRPHLGKIDVPTLVMVGDSDPLTPPDVAREIADAIPGSQLTIIPKCGHVSTLEQPDIVSAALLNWITM